MSKKLSLEHHPNNPMSSIIKNGVNSADRFVVSPNRVEIEGLIRVLSCSTGPSDSTRSHTILVYFARGNEKADDEQRLDKLNVPT